MINELNFATQACGRDENLDGTQPGSGSVEVDRLAAGLGGSPADPDDSAGLRLTTSVVAVEELVDGAIRSFVEVVG